MYVYVVDTVQEKLCALECVRLSVCVCAYVCNISNVITGQSIDQLCKISIQYEVHSTKDFTKPRGETLIITKYRGNNGYKRKQPRTQGYSLGHGSAQSAWQGIIWFGEDYRLEWHNV